MATQPPGATFDAPPQLDPRSDVVRCSQCGDFCHTSGPNQPPLDRVTCYTCFWKVLDLGLDQGNAVAAAREVIRWHGYTLDQQAADEPVIIRARKAVH